MKKLSLAATLFFFLISCTGAVYSGKRPSAFEAESQAGHKKSREICKPCHDAETICCNWYD